MSTALKMCSHILHLGCELGAPYIINTYPFLSKPAVTTVMDLYLSKVTGPDVLLLKLHRCLGTRPTTTDIFAVTAKILNHLFLSNYNLVNFETQY